MRLPFSSLLSPLLSVASLAWSGPQQPPSQPVTEVRVTAPVRAPYRPSVGEVREAMGTYLLETGQVLHVSGNRHRILAEIDGHGKAELIPVARNIYYVRDEDVAMEFGRGADGDEMTLTYSRPSVAWLPREAMDRIAALR